MPSSSSISCRRAVRRCRGGRRGVHGHHSRGASKGRGAPARWERSQARRKHPPVHASSSVRRPGLACMMTKCSRLVLRSVPLTSASFSSVSSLKPAAAPRWVPCGASGVGDGRHAGGSGRAARGTAGSAGCAASDLFNPLGPCLSARCARPPTSPQPPTWFKWLPSSSTACSSLEKAAQPCSSAHEVRTSSRCSTHCAGVGRGGGRGCGRGAWQGRRQGRRKGRAAVWHACRCTSPAAPAADLARASRPPAPHLGARGGVGAREDEAADALGQARDALDLHKVPLHGAQAVHLGQAPGVVWCGVVEGVVWWRGQGGWVGGWVQSGGSQADPGGAPRAPDARPPPPIPTARPAAPPNSAPPHLCLGCLPARYSSRSLRSCGGRKSSGRGRMMQARVAGGPQMLGGGM